MPIIAPVPLKQKMCPTGSFHEWGQQAFEWGQRTQKARHEAAQRDMKRDQAAHQHAHDYAQKVQTYERTGRWARH